MVASAPFATVPPGQRQLIRTSHPRAQGEKSFRIIIDEVPAADATAAKDSAGLKLQMRYVLPLFLTGASASHTAAPLGNTLWAQLTDNSVPVAIAQ